MRGQDPWPEPGCLNRQREPDCGDRAARTDAEEAIIEATAGAAAIVLGYFIGGIPVAYLAGRRLRGVDIRSIGSRNVGSINAGRELGVRVGLAVFAVDLAKAVLPVVVIRAAGLPEWSLFGAAGALVAGHNWSPYIGFAGGKGVVVLLGVSLAMMPGLSLLALPVVSAALLLTRSAVWAIGAGLVVLNTLILLSGEPPDMVALCIGLSVVVAGTHFARSGREIFDALAAGDLRRVGRIE